MDGKLRIKKQVDLLFLIAYIPIYLLLCCTAELFKISGLSAVVIMAGFLVWFFMLVVKVPEFFSAMLSWAWPAFACIAMLFLFSVMGYNTTMALNNMVFMVIISSIFLYFYEYETEGQGRTFLKLCIIDLLIACVFSIYRLLQHPELARYLSTGHSYEYTSVSAKGVVSFGVIYGLVYIFPVIIDKLVTETGKKKIPWIIFVAVLLWTIILAQFTIAIILCGLSCALYLYMKKTTVNSTVVRRIILIFIFLALLLSAEGILSLLIRNEVFPYEVNARLEEIYSVISLNTFSEGMDLFLRFELYSTSGRTIFSNLLLGKAALGAGTVGGHSEILDTLAHYGVIYFALLIWFFKNVLQRILRRIPEKDAQAYKMCIALFIFGSLINTSMWSATMVLLLGVAPSLLIFRKDEGRELNEGTVN